jgi:hypothetical protein
MYDTEELTWIGSTGNMKPRSESESEPGSDVSEAELGTGIVCTSMLRMQVLVFVSLVLLPPPLSHTVLAAMIRAQIAIIRNRLSLMAS